MKQVCNLNLQGRCHKGQKCKYLHGENIELKQEQQPPQQPNVKIYNKAPKQHYPKLLKWADLSKLPESQDIFQQNQELYGGDFLSCAKKIQNQREKDILQLFRKYQQSIKLQPEPKLPLIEYLRSVDDVQIILRFIPTIERKYLEFKEQVQERLFEILIQIEANYPNSSGKIFILNQSLSVEFKEALSQKMNQVIKQSGIFQGMKYLETHFDEVVSNL